MAIKRFLLMILFHANLVRSLKSDIVQSYEKNLDKNNLKVIDITQELGNKNIRDAYLVSDIAQSYENLNKTNPKVINITQKLENKNITQANLVPSLKSDIAESYEKNLDKNSPNVINMTQQLWNKSIKEANSSLILDAVEIQKARAQSLGGEKRYTILVKILAHFDFKDDPKLDRFCFINIHVTDIPKMHVLMKCFREFKNPIFRNIKVLRTSEEEGIKMMYDYYNKTIQ